ncbi:PRC-barrel domain-containing protein [Roseivirga sp. BDSF3-8]|uniref:PRC-barrel domain-containing protein n=1 Tax=Roseivirga sp. BDSF3-8 TaxID=3241598 RepID=UPI00353242C1
MAEHITLSGTSIIGTQVKNKEGEPLGRIIDLMIDMQSSIVAYFVLAYKEQEDNQKLFAVPVEGITPDTANKQLIINISRNTLEENDGFDKDNWPLKSNSMFLTDMQSHYGSGKGLPSRPAHG